MTARVFWNSGIQFSNSCAVYYVVQLVRCVLLSFVVFACVLILRKTALKNKVFLKGALWSLFIPVLFVGKMKFFYENGIGVIMRCVSICCPAVLQKKKAEKNGCRHGKKKCGRDCYLCY